MSIIVKKYFTKRLREIADAVDDDRCDIHDDMAVDILSTIGKEILSREQAIEHLNVSKATFTNYIRDGIIPAGRKIKGFQEKIWYKGELDRCIIRLNK